MTRILTGRTHIDSDGNLNLKMPTGMPESDVEFVVQLKPTTPKLHDPEEWKRFVDRTYGSCAGTGLERPDQGVFEVREPIE